MRPEGQCCLPLALSLGQFHQETLERLRSLAGPPPVRLARTEALAEENPAPQQAFAHAEAEVEAEDEVSQVLNASSDPLHQLLALQMKQNRGVDAEVGAANQRSGHRRLGQRRRQLAKRSQGLCCQGCLPAGLWKM